MEEIQPSGKKLDLMNLKITFFSLLHLCFETVQAGGHAEREMEG